MDYVISYLIMYHGQSLYIICKTQISLNYFNLCQREKHLYEPLYRQVALCLCKNSSGCKFIELSIFSA